MCVDKHHFKCCCCCSLTQGTVCIGIMWLIVTILYAVGGQWIQFVVTGVMSALFIMVIVKPHDVNTRKWLFYLYSALQVASIVTFAIVYIVYITSDGYKA